MRRLRVNSSIRTVKAVETRLILITTVETYLICVQENRALSSWSRMLKTSWVQLIGVKRIPDCRENEIYRIAPSR